MKYFRLVVFIFIGLCFGCPDTMDSGPRTSSNPYNSGQTQTFVAINSGLANALQLELYVTALDTVTVTLKDSGGNTLDSATVTLTETSSNSEDFKAINFYFTGAPAIDAASDYSFTVSSSAGVKVMATVSDYTDGSLSVDTSGDYAFTLETICDYSGATCPVSVINDAIGFDIIDLSVSNTIQTFIVPATGELVSFVINIQYPPSDSCRDEAAVTRGTSIDAIFSDSENNVLQVVSVTPSDEGDLQLGPDFDVEADTTYKLTILQNSDWVVTDTFFGDPFGELNSDPNAKDMFIRFYIICSSGTSGDPHFYGFQGQKYDVMGQSFEVYNLVTAPYLQLNSHFIPYYKTASQVTPTGTMIGDLGIKLYNSKMYINSNSTLAIVNGNRDISLENNWKVEVAPDVSVSNEVVGSGYEITIDTADMTLTFIRKAYFVSGLDPQYHFDYQAKLKQAKEYLHGLLGQTYEFKVFEEKSGAFKYLDGEEDDYRILSNDIFGDDFKYNKFENL